jgi:hypothetical protein
MELEIVFYDFTAIHIEDIRMLEEKNNEIKEGPSNKCPSGT